MNIKKKTSFPISEELAADQQTFEVQDFLLNNQECCLSDFEIKTILGQGSNGTVYKAY